MLPLHAKNRVSPAEVAGRDLDPGAMLGAGTARGVVWMILEQRLRRGRTPLVARADEEKLGLQAGGKKLR
jgi:hypothetical protein